MGRRRSARSEGHPPGGHRGRRLFAGALLTSVVSLLGVGEGEFAGLATVPSAHADDQPGGSWRYRDERGRVFFTDNPESIPPRYKSSATRIAPVEPTRSSPSTVSDKAADVVDDAERSLRKAIPDGSGALLKAGGGGGSSDFPFATVAVVVGEAIVIRIAARMTGLAIGLPGVVVACCAAAFVHSLHVPLLSSFGSFLVLFLVLWKLGRADSTETVALFMVVVAFLHVVSLYMLVKLPVY